MSRILLVDDDLGTLETFSLILHLRGFSVDTASSGQEGLQRARQESCNLLVTDLLLPDFSGIELLRYLRAEGVHVPALIMTGFGTMESALEAGRLGVLDYLPKPLFDDALVSAVEKGLAARSVARQPSGIPDAPIGAAATRWAELVLRAVSAEHDIRNLEEWGRLQGISRATVKNRCDAAGVDAKASLDLARVLRALVHAQRVNGNPNAMLEVDPRTLRRLFEAAGLSSTHLPATTPTPREFLGTQRFVTDPLALEALMRVME